MPTAPDPEPVVRPAVCRVAVIGAESTGKTRLCNALAQSLDGASFEEPLRLWVAQYGRSPQADEQREILQQQKQAEDQALMAALRAGKRWVFCDSAPLVTAVYSQFYFQDHSLVSEAVAHHRQAYAHTLLCSNDLGWQQDPGMRDGPQAQAHVQKRLMQVLSDHALPYFSVNGQGEIRAQLAVQFLAGVDFEQR